MDNFEVIVEVTYTETAFEFLKKRSPKLDRKISLPKGVELPVVGDEVAFLADAEDAMRAEFIVFRVCARRFLWQGVLPQMTVILTLGLVEEQSGSPAPSHPR